eukprot:scaffold4680_cov163-Chaetoceros_neogracile.AAC.6
MWNNQGSAGAAASNSYGPSCESNKYIKRPPLITLDQILLLYLYHYYITISLYYQILVQYIAVTHNALNHNIEQPLTLNSNHHLIATSSQQQKHDIFVGNLAFATTEEQIQQVFTEIGRIVKVRMVSDLETGKPRGFAFVEFEDPQAALSAIRNMNDYELNGRRLRVNFSNSSHLETLAGQLGMDMSKKDGNVNIVPNMGGSSVPSTAGGGAAVPMQHADIGTQAVANALRNMSKGEMYDVVAKLKQIADSDPDEARKIISGHPQLPEALLFLMSQLDMIKSPLSNGMGGAVPPPV